MECSICYESTATFTLSCSHQYCQGCIKAWFMKGTGTGCPMCRAPITFKGFHKVEYEWNQEAYETKCSEVFTQAFEATIAEYMDESYRDAPRRIKKWMLLDLKYALADLGTTYRVMLANDFCVEEMEYVFEEQDTFSDRYLTRSPGWDDEPLIHKALQPAYKKLRYFMI